MAKKIVKNNQFRNLGLRLGKNLVSLFEKQRKQLRNLETRVARLERVKK